MTDGVDPKRIVAAIVTGLLIWAGVLAWGIIRNQPEFDFRKPLVIIGVIVLFLGSWAALLLLRKRNSN